MTISTRITRCALIVVAGLAIAACGGGDATKKAAAADEKDAKKPGTSAESVLVIDGKTIGEDGKPIRSDTPTSETSAPKRSAQPRSVIDDDEDWPAPPLNGDGTIDDGPDPFQGERVQVQPLPIEDDPETTSTINGLAEQMRRVSRARWDAWLGAGTSPWQQGNDPFALSLVDITVERCGGARTVATGVVLGDETVVTTVHAIESASKRVRVSQLVGTNPRLPAMVRYLDIDDDVAVLKVPGLDVPSMPFYTPGNQIPKFGYAYGVANVGIAGTLRRTPAIVSIQESSITKEQPDGFAEEISDRSVQTLVGGITTGFSGGVVAASDGATLATGGFHGLIRARMPFRADTAGVVVPSRIVRAAIAASNQLDEWFEHPPGGCPQWRR